jgi:heat shock transcription factor
VVLDEDEFAKTLIPELFKHNNYASFVRQLNMYGFHKRVGLSDNSMKASERKNKSPSEYYNPYFKRGHPNLLWLINKPKGGAKGGAKPKSGARGKNEEIQERDSDEDGQDIEEVIGNVGNYPPALTQGQHSGSLERQNVNVIQDQLMEIQKQQGAITNAIARLRKDHNQLYQQSVAFQTLHDRHENSINAILTFLATVYNRSLDGQGPANIAQMFANGIPQEQQSGSVVDVTGQQDPDPGNRSPHRRQQRLLMAPPSQGGNGRVTSATPSASNTLQPPHQSYQSPKASIEELFDSPQDPSDPQTSSTNKTTPGAQNIMNIIQNTNAHHRASSQSHAIQFPDMLSHYENTHGATLTPEQRNAMLNNMNMLNHSTTSQNNALASPTPPQPPSLESLNMTQSEIDHLYKLQQDQDQRIANIAKEVEPLSPSGSIPGLQESNNGANGYFNTDGFGNPGDGNLDLDQYLDDGAFFGGGNGSPGGNLDFENLGGGGGYGDPSAYDLNGMGVSGFDDLGLGVCDGSIGNGGGGRVQEKQESPEQQENSRKRRRGN